LAKGDKVIQKVENTKQLLYFTIKAGNYVISKK